MLKRHQTRAVAYATTCITIIFIFLKLSAYSKASSKSIDHHSIKSNTVSEKIVGEVSDASSAVNLMKIRSLFKAADASADGRLTKKELAWSISLQIEKHLRNALRGNFKQFFALDKMKPNGQVEWDEWLQGLKKNEASKVKTISLKNENPGRSNNFLRCFVIDEYLSLSYRYQEV